MSLRVERIRLIDQVSGVEVRSGYKETKVVGSRSTVFGDVGSRVF